MHYDLSMSEKLTKCLDIKGLHRPYNKPLKSLYWVCAFARKNNVGARDFYYNFYLFHMRMVVRYAQEFNHIQWKEGLVSPKDAQRVLDLHKVYSGNFLNQISSVLHSRLTEDDKLIYRTYKNVSYYVTLAKKLRLIDESYLITQAGRALLKSSRFVYKFSQKEKEMLLNMLLGIDAEMFLTLIVIHDKMLKKNNGETFYRIYMNYLGKEDKSNYIGSYDANYIEVITYWLEQLDIFGKNNKVRKKVIYQLDKTYQITYNKIQNEYQAFLIGDYKVLLAKRKVFEQFEKVYKTIYATGKTDMGYVNLYDVKEQMHMGYDKFSQMLNDYYVENKKRTIILFSNIVSSIDKRKRFLVAGKVVLNVKLIL